MSGQGLAGAFAAFSMICALASRSRLGNIPELCLRRAAEFNLSCPFSRRRLRPAGQRLRLLHHRLRGHPPRHHVLRGSAPDGKAPRPRLPRLPSKSDGTCLLCRSFSSTTWRRIAPDRRLTTTRWTCSVKVAPAGSKAARLGCAGSNSEASAEGSLEKQPEATLMEDEAGGSVFSIFEKVRSPVQR